MKKCPFCGYQDKDDADDKKIFFNVNSVICENCGAEGPKSDGSKIKAEELWDSRPE